MFVCVCAWLCVGFYSFRPQTDQANTRTEKKWDRNTERGIDKWKQISEKHFIDVKSHGTWYIGRYGKTRSKFELWLCICSTLYACMRARKHIRKQNVIVGGSISLCFSISNILLLFNFIWFLVWFGVADLMKKQRGRFDCSARSGFFCFELEWGRCAL